MHEVLENRGKIILILEFVGGGSLQRKLDHSGTKKAMTIQSDVLAINIQYVFGGG